MSLVDVSAAENFNSIKVRLKLLAFFKAYYDRLFQFHKGTIKTNF